MVALAITDLTSIREMVCSNGGRVISYLTSACCGFVVPPDKYYNNTFFQILSK